MAYDILGMILLCLILGLLGYILVHHILFQEEIIEVVVLKILRAFMKTSRWLLGIIADLTKFIDGFEFSDL